MYAIAHRSNGMLAFAMTKGRTCQGQMAPMGGLEYEGRWIINCPGPQMAHGTYTVTDGKITRGVGVDDNGNKVEFSVDVVVEPSN